MSLTSSDVWTLFHSYAFDFSVWEIWGALAYGGRLVIVPYWVSRSADAFHDLLVSEQVTVLNQTPSAFRQLMAADESAGAGVELKLRLVIFGGEALELQSLRPWFARHGDRSPRLVNMFGITETTVHVTYRPLTRGRSRTGCEQRYRQTARMSAGLSAGRARSARAGRRARGNLRRRRWSGARLSEPRGVDGRTLRAASVRDSARSAALQLGRPRAYLPDGDIEYLGRIDQQVKVRGFRIELGEIEAVLASHAAVAEAVVVMKEDQSGDKRLVAYVVGEATGATLRDYLQERVPEYMVPAAFVMVERLPLTANGKVDRGALPAPEGLSLALGSGYLAPRTAVEEIVASIWSQLLAVERIGVATTSSSWAGIRCWPHKLSPEYAMRLGRKWRCAACSSSRRWRDWRARLKRAEGSGAELQAPPLGQSVARREVTVVVRAAAALVPGAVGAGECVLQLAVGSAVER